MKINLPLGIDGLPTGQPLIPLTPASQSALDQMLDDMTANICEAIRTRVQESAAPLFKQGYWSRELVVRGFGTDIDVRPRKHFTRGRFHLACRRFGMWFGYFMQYQYDQKVGDIMIADADTYRIVRQFKIFTPEDRHADE